MPNLIEALDSLLEDKKKLTLDSLVFEGIAAIDAKITEHYKGENKLKAYIATMPSVEEGARDAASEIRNSARHNDEMYWAGYSTVAQWVIFRNKAKEIRSMQNSYNKVISDLCTAVGILKDGLKYFEDWYKKPDEFIVSKSAEAIGAKAKEVRQGLTSLLEPYGAFINWLLENKERKKFVSHTLANEKDGYEKTMKEGLICLFNGRKKDAYNEFNKAREMLDRRAYSSEYRSLTALIDNIDVAAQIVKEAQHRFKVAKAFVTGSSN